MSVPSNTSPSPSRPGQVYVMQEEQVEGLRGTSHYRGGCACLAGIFLIISAGFALGFEIFIITELRGAITGTGIWCGLVFFPTGIVSMVGGCKKSKCSIITTLVLNIISAMSAFSLILVSALFASFNFCHNDFYSPIQRGGGWECVASYGACIAAALIALTCNIILMVNTSKVIFGCCGGGGGQGQVHDRLRPEPVQPRIVDPTREPNDTLSQLNGLIPMFYKSAPGVIHCTAEENCDHIPRR